MLGGVPFKFDDAWQGKDHASSRERRTVGRKVERKLDPSRKEVWGMRIVEDETGVVCVAG